MYYKAFAITHVGSVRENNEDNYYLCGHYKHETTQTEKSDTVVDALDECLFSVCDGMGGEELGELASLIAVSTLREFESRFDSQVGRYVANANRLICNEIMTHGGKRIGTTFAALYVRDGTAHAYNIGDSRIYAFRDNELVQISKDHTHVQNLVNMGVLSETAARTHPERHKLTQHFGIFPEEMVIEPHASEPFCVKSGDIFLLCSDGLTDMLSDAEISDVLRTKCSLEDREQMLLSAALARGGVDNITLILAEMKRSSGIFARLKYRKKKT